MIGKTIRLVWPFVLSILILVLIPQYFFNRIGIGLGTFVASLLLLFQAKRFGLFSLSIMKVHRKILQDKKKDRQREKDFYKYLSLRIDTRVERLFRTIHAESSEVLTYIFPIIKYKNEKEGKNIKMKLVSCLDKDGLKEELKKLDPEMKKDIMNFVENGYVEFHVLGKDERHFCIMDGRDVMVQEDHLHEHPKDMIYAEDSIYLSRKYTQKFSKLLTQSEKLRKEELKQFFKGD